MPNSFSLSMKSFSTLGRWSFMSWNICRCFSHQSSAVESASDSNSGSRFSSGADADEVVASLGLSGKPLWCFSGCSLSSVILSSESSENELLDDWQFIQSNFAVSSCVFICKNPSVLPVAICHTTKYRNMWENNAKLISQMNFLSIFSWRTSARRSLEDSCLEQMRVWSHLGSSQKNFHL